MALRLGETDAVVGSLGGREEGDRRICILKQVSLAKDGKNIVSRSPGLILMVAVTSPWKKTDNRLPSLLTLNLFINSGGGGEERRVCVGRRRKGRIQFPALYIVPQRDMEFCVAVHSLCHVCHLHTTPVCVDHSIQFFFSFLFLVCLATQLEGGCYVQERHFASLAIVLE